MTLPAIAVVGGTGNLGAAIAWRLARAGYPVTIGSRNAESAEKAAAEFFADGPSFFDDPAFRSALGPAINTLPPDQKAVIGLWLQGIPIDAKDPTTNTIARILKCDERTVRNRRDRAFKALRKILEEVKAHAAK